MLYKYLKRFKLKPLCFIPLTFLLTSCTPSTRMIKPVDNFDVNRYTGTWYEIARYPHRFEKNLSNVTATYTLKEDGSIEVLNRGFNTTSGKWKEAKGKAFFKNNPSTGLLKVSFFWPFYGEYKIIRLEKENYSYVVITSSRFNYLWILAREPIMEEEELSQLLEYIEDIGFDRSRITMVDQSPKP